MINMLQYGVMNDFVVSMLEDDLSEQSRGGQMFFREIQSNCNYFSLAV